MLWPILVRSLIKLAQPLEVLVRLGDFAPLWITVVIDALFMLKL